MTTREARVESQAKLNLFLRVLAREESGYHQIETLFCRITLADSITVRVGGSSKHLDIAGDRLPTAGLGPIERNLAWRAAEAYSATTGFPTGFEITIQKRIPVGGGLGGGSADAAGVLRVLNGLNPQPIPGHELLEIAATLGADVPFLTQDVSTMAIGRGYGEKLEFVATLSPKPVWLLVPGVSVNTADAYRWLDQSVRSVAPSGIDARQVESWDAVSRIATNDFESAVSPRVPVIGRLLAGFRSPELGEILGRSAIVLMSGSGSTVAVVAGEIARNHWTALPPVAGVEIIETQTAAFVEPVVLTH